MWMSNRCRCSVSRPLRSVRGEEGFRPSSDRKRWRCSAASSEPVRSSQRGSCIPDGVEPRMYRSIGREHQQMPGPGESHVVLAGVVEGGDSVGRLEGGPSAVGPELPAHRIHVGVVIVKRARDHHVPLPSLGLVDGGNGDRLGECRHHGGSREPDGARFTGMPAPSRASR